MRGLGLRQGLGLRGSGIRAAASSGTLLLDTLSAAPAAAFSTRKLRTAFAGSPLRVRRSSDNAEQDIPFAAGALDAANLAAFVGSNSAFVVKWYDQTANTRDVSTAVANQQPRIVNAGANDTLNGVIGPKPLQSAGAGSILRTAANPSWILAGYSVSYVGQLRVAALGGPPRYVVGYDNSGGSSPTLHVGQRDDSALTIAHWSDDHNFSHTADTAAHVNMCVFTNPGSVYYLDGVSLLVPGGNPLAPLSGASVPLTVGCSFFSSFYGTQTAFDGVVPEVIVWGSTLGTTDINTVKASQSTYFGIAVT